MKLDSITINLFVSDVKESAVFYSGMLGMEIAMQVPEKGDPVWLFLKKGQAGIMIQSKTGIPEELKTHIPQFKGAPMLIYIQGKGISEVFEKARLRGCLVSGMETTFYGHKEFSMTDPDGYLVTVAEEI